MNLFSSFDFGPFHLNHRVVMPPLTRMRASPEGVPSPYAATYYGQRATQGGLIIAEATQISQQAQGYPQTPGIYTQAHVAGWQAVTEAVHKRGGIIFLQLWHVGRISHSSFQKDGLPPVAPSAIAAAGNAFTSTFAREPHETPRALSVSEIQEVIADYRKAAEHAKAAGFDGVEVHAANGYLLQQFLEDKTNHRTDEYGGSIENRARLLFEVIDAVAQVWPLDRIGVRISPYCNVGDIDDSDPKKLYAYVVKKLAEKRVTYLHIIESKANWASASDGKEQAVVPHSVAEIFRPYFSGALISSGGFDATSAQEAIDAGTADLIAFGRAFIANPDLPARLQKGADLNKPDSATFYGGAEKGYTDYPQLAEVNG